MAREQAQPVQGAGGPVGVFVVVAYEDLSDGGIRLPKNVGVGYSPLNTQKQWNKMGYTSPKTWLWVKNRVKSKWFALVNGNMD